MYKRKDKRQGPSLSWRRKRDHTVTPRDAADWDFVYLAFTKDGEHDGLLIVCLICNIAFWYLVESPGGVSGWLVVLIYATPLFTCYMAGYNWLLLNGWVRARAMTSRPADQYPWFKCLVDWEFLIALGLSHVIGLQVLALGLYAVDIVYRPLIGGTMVHDWILIYLELFGYA